MVQPPKDLETFSSLLQIVQALRAPDGCPWDKEQTHRTLAPFAIEEAHELAEAIENDDQQEIVLELGDLLLQVALHAEIGRGESRFTIDDVIYAINEKMVRRHPHVFSSESAKDSTEVLANWAKIKDEEKRNKEKAKPTIEGEKARFDVAPSLPALARAQKIGEKTKRLRFDWTKPSDVLGKVHEEYLEVKEEMDKGTGTTPEALEHEIGDLLFSAAQLARHLGLDAEQCLRTANNRFENRFFTMRKQIAESGRTYDEMSLDELETAWQKVKLSLK